MFWIISQGMVVAIMAYSYVTIYIKISFKYDTNKGGNSRRWLHKYAFCGKLLVGNMFIDI